mmetsp:Transcript_63883/g.75629  ORF Transcript_63883/g.75629 Transcript_63883/m.75629 type:complete len:95 (-) Transcript_63883:114-398(-)
MAAARRSSEAGSVVGMSGWDRDISSDVTILYKAIVIYEGNCNCFIRWADVLIDDFKLYNLIWFDGVTARSKYSFLLSIAIKLDFQMSSLKSITT